MPKITLQNNSTVTIHGIKAGGTMKVNADENGNPLDFHLRRRLRDSKIDGALSVVIDKPKTEKTSKIIDDMEG